MSRASTAVPITALARKPFIPTWEAVLAMFLHAVVLFAIGFGEMCTRPRAPMINPDDVMMVHAAALPKSLGRMPDKAMRAARPAQGSSAASAPAPPPTASDMVIEKKDAPKTRGRRTTDHSSDRADLLNQARREALLDSLANAPIGDRDQLQTSPDGVDWELAFGAGAGGAINDPELARFVAGCRSAIVPNWTPLPSTLQAHPDYEVYVKVTVDENGKMGTPQLYKGTGDSSFDNSALMAVRKTGRLPAPPAKYRESASKGVVIVLSARDK